MDETDRAVITAVGSLVVAVVAASLAAFNGSRLTKLKADLDRRQSAEDAKQEYEYQALKRLYEQCLPLVFQANEMAVNARHRVVSLARSARDQALPAWLMDHGYYYFSTIYYLLAPVTTVKILQRRLTAVDLSLDTALQRHYELLKIVFRTFTDAFDLAKASEPVLPYYPDRADPGEPGRERLLREEPEVYRRQGFYVGNLERIAEAMIKESNGKARCSSFGEFVNDFAASNSQLAGVVPAFDEIFIGFHPKQNPVLWRVLIAQSMLADVVLRSQQAPKEKLSSLLPEVGPELIEEFDWRPVEDRHATNEDDVALPLRVARAYLAELLVQVDERLGSLSPPQPVQVTGWRTIARQLRRRPPPRLGL